MDREKEGDRLERERRMYEREGGNNGDRAMGVRGAGERERRRKERERKREKREGEGGRQERERWE